MTGIEALLREVGEVLVEQPDHLLSRMELEHVAAGTAKPGCLRLVVEVSIPPDRPASADGEQAHTTHQQLAVLELYGRLREVRDIGQLRALATAYGIDSAKLEALLPGRDK